MPSAMSPDAVQLTPVAIAAGRRLADRLFGGQTDRRLDYENIPTVIFSHPPIGTVGLTEQRRATLRDRERQRVPLSFVPLYHALTAAQAARADEARDRGPAAAHRRRARHRARAPTRCCRASRSRVRMGATKQDFDDTVAIHPTSAEELVTMR